VNSRTARFLVAEVKVKIVQCGVVVIYTCTSYTLGFYYNVIVFQNLNRQYKFARGAVNSN